jgi:hypothetical protein
VRSSTYSRIAPGGGLAFRAEVVDETLHSAAHTDQKIELGVIRIDSKKVHTYIFIEIALVIHFDNGLRGLFSLLLQLLTVSATQSTQGTGCSFERVQIRALHAQPQRLFHRVFFDVFALGFPQMLLLG